jgi:putative serine protease PepD
MCCRPASLSESDGSCHTAKVIGTNPKTDLAVIQITATGTFTTVTFGDSDRLCVGERVVAVGAPRGLRQDNPSACLLLA